MNSTCLNESSNCNLSSFITKTRDTSFRYYGLYLGLSVVCFIILLICLNICKKQIRYRKKKRFFVDQKISYQLPFKNRCEQLKIDKEDFSLNKSYENISSRLLIENIDNLKEIEYNIDSHINKFDNKQIIIDYLYQIISERPEFFINLNDESKIVIKYNLEKNNSNEIKCVEFFENSIIMIRIVKIIEVTNILTLKNFIKEIDIMYNNEDIFIKVYGIVYSIDSIYIKIGIIYEEKKENFYETIINCKEPIEKFEMFSLLLNQLKILSEKNIVHNNLKPTNIFYETSIQNFKFSDMKILNTNIFSSYKINNSIKYIDPESIININLKSNIKIDLWSLGIMAFEIFFPEINLSIPWDINYIKKNITIYDLKTIISNNLKIQKLSKKNQFIEINNDFDYYNDKLFNIFVECLNIENKERPNIEDIIFEINNIITSLKQTIT